MRRLDLVADCGSCAAVCCIALPFDASEEFAIDKAAGVACRHLRPDCRCAIHDRLVADGFGGCAIYDCYGAGPRATRAFAEGRRRNDSFLALRVVHELLWLLTEAQKFCPSTHEQLATQLASAIDELDALDVSHVAEADLRPHRDRAHALLRRVGDAVGGRARLRRALAVIA